MERKFFPVNPVDLDEDQSIRFMERQAEVAELEPNVFIRYRGSETFLQFVKERRIGVGTLIRVTNYGRIVGQCLIVTKDGLQEYLVEDGGKVYTPKEIFDDPHAPRDEGDWEIAGQDYIP